MAASWFTGCSARVSQQGRVGHVLVWDDDNTLGGGWDMVELRAKPRRLMRQFPGEVLVAMPEGLTDLAEMFEELQSRRQKLIGGRFPCRGRKGAVVLCELGN